MIVTKATKWHLLRYMLDRQTLGGAGTSRQRKGELVDTSQCMTSLTKYVYIAVVWRQGVALVSFWIRLLQLISLATCYTLNKLQIPVELKYFVISLAMHGFVETWLKCKNMSGPTRTCFFLELLRSMGLGGGEEGEVSFGSSTIRTRSQRPVGVRFC